MIARAGLKLKGINPVGKEAKLCLLNVEDENSSYELKAFFKTDAIKKYIEDRYGNDVLNELLQGRGEGVTFSVIYKPDLNSYNGRTTLQLVVEDFK